MNERVSRCRSSAPNARLRLAAVHEKKVRKPTRERLPDLRSDEDCRRLIASLQMPIYRGCFTLIYAYGSRISEAVTLPISAVDSKQMVLRVIGKGNKERLLPLTEPILLMLRNLWKIHCNPRWLFPSRRRVSHLPDATARAAFIKARDACGFNSDFRPHSLRHSFATHRLERGGTRSIDGIVPNWAFCAHIIWTVQSKCTRVRSSVINRWQTAS
jgi:integrase/recombinase XerD